MTIFLVIVALLGNLLLFTGAIFGDLKDNSIAWILVIAAICIDIWLIATVISNHQPREKTDTSRDSHNSTTSSSLRKKRQEVIQGLNPQIQEKDATIKALYEFEQKFTRIDNLLNLFSELTDYQNDKKTDFPLIILLLQIIRKQFEQNNESCLKKNDKLKTQHQNMKLTK